MRLQPRARAGIALIAAYAVALQALLLAVIAPPSALAGTAVLPICAGAPGHPVPAGRGQDCLDACLTGCCGTAPILSAPAHDAARVAPRPLHMVIARPDPRGSVPLRVAKAHRSRAPPPV